jgi:hypothetical protein
MKKLSQSKTRTRRAQPLFVTRAECAMQRVARKLRAEHRRLNMPLLIWKNGRAIRLKP